MTNDLARWQFATTSIYHFLFVPVTIGLAFLVALLQTSWYRSDNPTFKRLTKFFGTLLLINVAVGVVTGLVQEFEFGMNWSNYSRFVGNIFGGPLAMEGLGGLLPRVHLPRDLDLRLGPALQTAPPDVHLAGGCRLDALGPVHHGRQLVDAAPGGVRHELPPRPAAHRCLGAVHQPGLRLGLPTCDLGLGGDRGPRHAGRLGLAPQAGPVRHGLPPHRHHCAGRPHPGCLRQYVHRERARRRGGQVPAHEDRRRRGAVEHLPLPLLVLTFQTGGGINDRDADQDHRGPRPACRSWPPTTSTGRCRG